MFALDCSLIWECRNEETKLPRQISLWATAVQRFASVDAFGYGWPSHAPTDHPLTMLDLLCVSRLDRSRHRSDLRLLSPTDFDYQTMKLHLIVWRNSSAMS